MTAEQSKSSRKRKRKQVRFQEKHTEIPVFSFSKEQNQQIWYQRSELTLFKLDVKCYTLGLTQGSHFHSEERGLERYNAKRLTNKALAQKSLIRAIRGGMVKTPQELSHLSKTISAWSRNEAFRIAFKDFCDVYHPNMELPELPSLPLEELISPDDDSNAATIRTTRRNDGQPPCVCAQTSWVSG